jgi:hypothetical protein
VYSTWWYSEILNGLIYKSLCKINKICTSSKLQNRCGCLSGVIWGDIMSYLASFDPLICRSCIRGTSGQVHNSYEASHVLGINRPPRPQWLPGDPSVIHCHMQGPASFSSGIISGRRGVICAWISARGWVRGHFMRDYHKLPWPISPAHSRKLPTQDKSYWHLVPIALRR